MSDATSAAKRRAAEEAVRLVQSGMCVGLGTGSTASLVVELLGARLGDGTLRDITAVPTSRRTKALAEGLGIPLTELGMVRRLDLTIDGADEVDGEGRMIKGGGGALLWEKMVAQASERYAIVVDPSKLVERLGRAFPLPIEVVTFGWETHLPEIRTLGAEALLRMQNGVPYRTDEGHYLLDARFPDGIDDPPAIERALRARAGVVATGLFLDFHPQVIVGR